MRKPMVRVFVHLVWATWDREPRLDNSVLAPVHAAIAATALRLGCAPVVVGGVSDHVHVLVGMPATLSIAELVRHLKGSSSHLLNHELAPGLSFRWQGAYGAFSVAPGRFDDCQAYVLNQDGHHNANNLDNEWETTHETEPGEGQAL